MLCLISFCRQAHTHFFPSMNRLLIGQVIVISFFLFCLHFFPPSSLSLLYHFDCRCCSCCCPLICNSKRRKSSNFRRLNKCVCVFALCQSGTFFCSLSLKWSCLHGHLAFSISAIANSLSLPLFKRYYGDQLLPTLHDRACVCVRQESRVLLLLLPVSVGER